MGKFIVYRGNIVVGFVGVKGGHGQEGCNVVKG